MSSLLSSTSLVQQNSLSGKPLARQRRCRPSQLVPFCNSPFSQFYVPYFKTFYLKNGQTREIKQAVKEEGNRTLVQNDTIERISEEKILAYLPHGNHKW